MSYTKIWDKNILLAKGGDTQSILLTEMVNTVDILEYFCMEIIKRSVGQYGSVYIQAVPFFI